MCNGDRTNEVFRFKRTSKRLRKPYLCVCLAGQHLPTRFDTRALSATPPSMPGCALLFFVPRQGHDLLVILGNKGDEDSKLVATVAQFGATRPPAHCDDRIVAVDAPTRDANPLRVSGSIVSTESSRRRTNRTARAHSSAYSGADDSATLSERWRAPTH